MRAAVSIDMTPMADNTAAANTERILETRVRTMHCLFGILQNQQQDELCRNCKSFTTTLEAARKKLIETETCMSDCSCGESTRSLFLVYTILGEITESDTPVPQRKKGACRLPDGTCMLTAPAHLAGCA
jgi:hypothetical protein